MNRKFTLETLGFAGICVGLTLATGCKTRYGGEDASFRGSDAKTGSAAITEIQSGENPMPKALSGAKPADVTYPAPKAPKQKEYWEIHSDPYAGAKAPSSTPAATPAASTAGCTKYTVKSGDTFGGIAAKNKVSLKSLKAANSGIDYNKIKVGQTINIPGASKSAAPAAASSTPGVYVVKNGDILGRIARQHGVKIADLKAANGLTGDTIKVGQKLKIPGKAAAAAPAQQKAADKGTPAASVKVEVPVSAPDKVVVAPPAISVPEPAPVAVEPPFVPDPPAISPTSPDVRVEPVSAPVVQPAPATSMTTYTINNEKDWFELSLGWNVSTEELMAANPGVTELKPGMLINVPAKK